MGFGTRAARMVAPSAGSVRGSGASARAWFCTSARVNTTEPAIRIASLNRRCTLRGKDVSVEVTSTHGLGITDSAEGQVVTATEREAGIVALGARVHLFVQPRAREEFIAMFRDVLGCDVSERDFGLPHPLLLVAFSDGSAFSVEFTELAPSEIVGNTLVDEQALRGAWLEFRTTDLEGHQQKLRRAGIREFRHTGSGHAYFSAPGGQVFRLLDVAYVGP